MDRPQDVTATMYVQVARGMRFDGTSLTLVDLAPSTVYLACQPDAAVGHLPTGLFLDEWYGEPSGVVIRPVPAVLSLLDANRPPASDARLMLSLPRIREAGLEYQAQLLDGDIPPTSGACVLFIRPAVPPDWLGLLAHGAPRKTELGAR
jgi:hypothetical protein